MDNNNKNPYNIILIVMLIISIIVHQMWFLLFIVLAFKLWIEIRKHNDRQ